MIGNRIEKRYSLSRDGTASSLVSCRTLCKDQQDLRDPPAKKDLKDRRDQRARRDQLVYLVHRELKELKDHKVPRVLQAKQDRRVPRVTLVHRGRPGLQVRQ